jgi:ACS family hexuronate transporter-like MFS transporter
MLIAEEKPAAPPRRPSWKWLVCGLLLLATMLNYMDRLTINLTAVEIKREMGLNDEQYGKIERAFGIGFAIGALFMGWSADRWTVRWLYPVAVLAWSAAGFATGFAQLLFTLMLCRFALGLAEAGNWPCALRTTQHILPASQRTMGNSILQSGASVGAVLTPIIVQALVFDDQPSSWRYPFFVIGVLGSVWIVFWLAAVGPHDLPSPRNVENQSAEKGVNFLAVIFQRRFLVLFVTVIAINLTWHFLRVWLPLYLRESLLFSRKTVNYFISAYYAATDVGAIVAGLLTLYFVRVGRSVHVSRVFVFAGAAALTALTVLIPLLDHQVREQPVTITATETVRELTGPGLLLFGVLLLVGVGSLAQFPVYYSLSQELTVRNQGKLTGGLGFCTWTVTAFMHPMVGSWLDQTKSEMGVADYRTAITLFGLVPLLGLLALVTLWGKDRSDEAPAHS